MEKFTFTDLSGTERTLHFAQITLCKRTENGSMLLEWLEDGSKCYCFVDDPQAAVIEQSLIEWLSKTEPAAPAHRHPLFPKHDQLKLKAHNGDGYLLDARRFMGLRQEVDGVFIVLIEGDTYMPIDHACGVRLKKHLVARNAILDLDEGDM